LQKQTDPRIDLSNPAIKREQLRDLERLHLKHEFGSREWSLDVAGAGSDGELPPPRYVRGGLGEPIRLLRDVGIILGDGKEATVYRCTGDRSAPFSLAAAKIFRAQKFRAFADDSAYRAGDVIRDRRAAKAMQGKTRKGRQLSHTSWVDREWDTLCRMHDAGGDVPAPYARTPHAILMQYLGDASAPAPLLVHARLDPARARTAFERVLANVELLLSCDRVHGDLSAYNILYDEQQEHLQLIDFPQAVNARTNPNASALLLRDVTQLCRHFRRYNIQVDPSPLSYRLWTRYLRGTI
jgi:RIO kinase 1